MLRIICECNKQLTVPPESGFMLWWKDTYKDLSQKEMMDDRTLSVILDDILSSRKMETWQLQKEELMAFVGSHSPKNYAELCSLVYYHFGYSRGKRPEYWGDKNNYYIHHLEAITALFPKAKFIHLVRDGRDVACSYRKLKQLKSTSAYAPRLTAEIDEIALEWDDNNTNIFNFLKNIEKENQYVVKYEEVLLQLEKTCRNICTFLQVEYDPEMLEYHIANKELSLEPSETIDWKKKTLEKPDRSRIGQYKKQLRPLDIERFNQIARTSLQRYGYKS